MDIRRREFLKIGTATAIGRELAFGREGFSKAKTGSSTPWVAAGSARGEGQGPVAPDAYVMERFNATPGAAALVKSLGDAAEYVLRWKPPENAEAWRTRRAAVESAFRKAIGLTNLPTRAPLAARVVNRHDMGDHTLENVLFESRPGFPVSANLYRSKSGGTEKRPAILCPIGHYLSAGKAASDVQARCMKLAQMGFVVLTYDAIGQGERLVPGNIHHDAGYALLPLGETIAGWMVWDSMRAIDYLLTLPDVDPQRIGVTGNSGGGLNTLFTAALDPRARAAVVVGFTFEFNNWLKYGGTHCTCTHLPGMFRSFEWFEVAGLIAPRALMMMQGERDGIFPISGARHSASNTAAVYAVLGESDQVQFRELAGQPHAYSRPYREQMYGFMARRLLGQGNGEAVSEGDVEPLSEEDPRLLCDRDGSVFPQAPSVVDMVGKAAMKAIANFPVECSKELGKFVRPWVGDLTAPPELRPQFLAPRAGKPQTVRGGLCEAFSFSSEDGEYIPGLFWRPETRAATRKTIIIADDRGKAAVAESGLVAPLLEAGFAVMALDLRGRGETCGRFGPGWTVNFRLLANQVELGRPLAGRRAYDLRRAADYLGVRDARAKGDLIVVGLGDDALPALLAAAIDERFSRLAMAGYFHSFISQMRARVPRARSKMSESWNNPQGTGRIDAGDYEVDFGSVIPSALLNLDVPNLVAAVSPRKALFCQARDARAPGAEALVARFRQVTRAVGGDWLEYHPDQTLDGQYLRGWLERGGAQ